VAVVCIFVLFFGVVFTMRTPDGILVVTVDVADAEISVDDGKVTLRSPGEEAVEIEVVEGKHTLKVKKGGFHTFTREFSIESGGKETVSVELRPVARKVAAPKTAVASTGRNWALEFDGKSSSVHIPTLDYDGSHPITMEAFVLSRTHAQSGVIGTRGLRVLAADNDGLWQASVIMKEPGCFYQIGQYNTKTGKPLHLAGVLDGRKLELYLD
jgi:hypothetical protein